MKKGQRPIVAGLSDMDAIERMLYGNVEDDPDLEAELLALQEDVDAEEADQPRVSNVGNSLKGTTPFKRIERNNESANQVIGAYFVIFCLSAYKCICCLLNF